MDSLLNFFNIFDQGSGLQVYVKPVAVFLISFLFLNFLIRFFSAHFRKFAKTTVNNLDDLIAELLDKTHLIFVFVISFYIGSYFLDQSSLARFVGKQFVFSLLIIQTVLWLVCLVNFYIMKNYQKWGITLTQANVSIFFLRIVLWVFALLILLENFGIRVTPLIAGLGIGGIAVALAVQSVLGEIIASLSIIIDKPFVVGDFIVVGQCKGNVEKVGFQTTRIRSISGELVVLSNNELIRSTIQNYRDLPRRRVLFSLGVVYETDAENIARIPDIIKDIVDKHPNAKHERVHFVEFGDFSLNFEVAYHVLTSDYVLFLDTRQEINLEIIKKFRAQNIDFAYPTQTLIAGSRVEVDLKK